MATDQVKPMLSCPKRQPTVSERNWYKLPDAPDFDVCSRCFHDHVRNTPFSAHFQLKHDPTGSSRLCDFNFPRVQATFRQALEQGDFGLFSEYIVHLNEIPRCKGNGTIVRPEEGFSWYQLKDPDLASKFGACRACYEDFIVPAGFTAHFADNWIPQPSDRLFVCDMGWTFTQRLVENCRDWSQFLVWAMYRQDLPQCAGATEVDAESRAWFRIRDPELTDLWMCEACHYDLASMTVAEQSFYRSTNPPLPGTKLTCFAGGNVPLRVALNRALEKKDFGIFLRAAYVVVRNPPCRKDGIQGTTWYSLIPACAEFDVCRACYTMFEATGIGHLLAPKTVPPEEKRLCNLNPEVPGAIELCKKLDLAIDRGEPETFTDYARRIVDIPPCPRSEAVTGRKWYRHNMFSCCPACWIQAPIEGTSLASSAFSSQDEIYEGSLKCDFYSARVRGLWQEACAKNDLPGFVAFMQKRLEIWNQTYPLIQQQLAMMRMNMMRQQTLLISSSMLQGGNNIAAAAGVHGNYGNSTIGYGYETYSGAQGAAQFNEAMGMHATGGGIAGSIAQLQGLWESVE